MGEYLLSRLEAEEEEEGLKPLCHQLVWPNLLAREEMDAKEESHLRRRGGDVEEEGSWLVLDGSFFCKGQINFLMLFSTLMLLL